MVFAKSCRKAVKVALLVVAFASTQALAQGVVPSPTQGVNLGINSFLNGVPLATVQSQAANAIPRDQINTPSGVAGLDTNGNVTAPVSSPSVAAGTVVHIGSLAPWSTLGMSEPARPVASFFDTFGDGDAAVNSILIGGLQDGVSAYVKLQGATVGKGDLGGDVFTVQDTITSTYGNRGCAGDQDGVLMCEISNSNPPLSKFGQDITNSDGISRTVTFTGTGFTVSPQMNAYQIWQLTQMPNARVYTNMDNGAPQTQQYIATHPNEYFGYLPAGACSNSATATTCSVWTDQVGGKAGWRTENNGGPITTAPGANPGDQQDTIIWGNRPHPAVFIGMSDKKFIENPFFRQSSGDDSLSRQFNFAEYDYDGGGCTQDYQCNMEGLAFNFDTHGVHADDNSYGIYMGGFLPVDYIAAPDAEGRDFQGPAFSVGSWGGGMDQTQGAQKVLAQFKQQDGPDTDNGHAGSGDTDALVFVQRRINDNSTGQHQAPSDVALSIEQEINPGNIGHAGTGGSSFPQAAIQFVAGHINLCAFAQGTPLASGQTAQAACDLSLWQNQVAVNNTLNVLPLGVSANDGLTVGTQIAGHVAALGVYAAAGYPNNLLELGLGQTTELSVDTSGNLAVAGTVRTGQLIAVSADGTGAAFMAAPDRSDMDLSNDAGSSVTLHTGGVTTGPITAASLNVSGSATLAGGGAVGNGQSVTFYPKATGVGAPGLTASGADTMAISTNDGGASYLQVGAVIETLATPSSSASPCVAGQFTDDANYHYVCVATNTWKRVALSSF